MGNLEILYSDKYIIVCIKPCGVTCEEDGMVSALRRQVGGDVYCVHRLDRPVGGVMVYARSGKAAALLSEAIAAGRMTKEYRAVVHGIPEQPEGTLSDLLFFDRAKNKSFVVKRERKGVKKAELEYRTLGSITAEGEDMSLVNVILHTGRTHQIRVQFGSRKHAVVGDMQYGSKVSSKNIALFSHKIVFEHPFTYEEMSFEADCPDAFPFNLFQQNLNKSEVSHDNL